jgi:hypothetical protein
MYDFRTLSPLDFEELVRDLLQAELQIRLESFSPGRDQGIDFRFASGMGDMIVQAKHYVESGIEPLVRAAKAEHDKVIKLNSKRYIFATSVALSPAQKTRIRRAMPNAPLVEADIFGRGDLNNLLGLHPEVERKHFKLWLASTAVLERILHSGVYNRTAAEMDIIRSMTSKFVHNESVPAAEAILANSGALIIAGEPGVGKTTLARMLVWLHAEQDWKISVIDDIHEAFEIPACEEKRLIFFDDFLGQVRLSTDLIRGMDQRFPPFLHRVRSQKNLRFILTTRDYILRQAQAQSSKLDSAAVKTSGFTLNVGHYTRSARAKMLYNHLYFSELSPDDVDALLADDYFLKMIDHQNFNPRLIELLTAPDYLAIAAKPIREVVDAVLANPQELWERPYRTQISEEGRALMLALFFNGSHTSIPDLEQSFGRMLEATEAAISRTDRPPYFRRALKELEGSVLAIENRKVRFSNPGVRDFLERAIDDDSFLPSAIENLTEFAELDQCWTVFNRTNPSKFELRKTGVAWSRAIGRMLEGGSGSPLQRLEFVLDAFELLKEDSLVVHVETAATDLDGAEIAGSESNRGESVLEQLATTLLPPEVAVHARRIVSAAVAEMLISDANGLNLEEVESVAAALSKFGHSQTAATAAIHEALKTQIDDIDAILSEMRTVDELDDFEGYLNKFMLRYGYQDRRVERDIEYRRQRILEGPPERDGRGNYGGSRTAETPDVSDEEIRSMFRALKR